MTTQPQDDAYRKQQLVLSLIDDDVERLYAGIYAQLKDTQTLPTLRVLARQLKMGPEQASRCVYLLRRAGRIHATTLLPTNYGQRWREMPLIEDE